MKDWKRSPEPPSMMGPQPPVQSATPPTESQSSHSSLDEVLPGAYIAPFLGNEGSSKMASMAAAAEEETHERQARQDARVSKMMSLKSMAMTVICRNIHMVEDIGAMPYSLAGPVLRHCSASQLMVIEGNSPQIMSETEDLWRRLAHADLASVRRKDAEGLYDREPPASWRRLYLRELGAEKEAKEAASARLRERLAAATAERDSRGIVVDDAIAKSHLKKRRGLSTAKAGVTSAGQRSKGQTLMSKARAATHLTRQLTQPRSTARSEIGNNESTSSRIMRPPSMPRAGLTIRAGASAATISSLLSPSNTYTPNDFGSSSNGVKMIFGKTTPIASVDRATVAAQQAEPDTSQMRPIKKRPKGNNGMRITPVKRARHAAASLQEAPGLSNGSSNARHSKSMISIKSSSPPDTSRRAGSSSCPANDRSWSDYQCPSHSAAHPPRRSTETRA